MERLRLSDRPLQASEIELLLDLADSAIVAALSGRPLGPPSIASLPEGLRVLTGAFVTLTVDGELNGCIGMIEGTEPLGQAVPRLAVSAAFEDPRLPALRPADYARLSIEISVLSPLEPIEVNSRAGLIAVLEQEHPGLLITDGFTRAVFLPAVWETLPDPEDFLDHLLRKAGLRPGTWPKGLRAYRFAAQEYHRRAGAAGAPGAAGVDRQDAG